MITKEERAQRRAINVAVLAERERIRNRMHSHLRALVTSRGDEYGAGWNGALATVKASLERRDPRDE